jgi:hypothetical protein
MPKPYSQDLRDRVIDAVERGKMARQGPIRKQGRGRRPCGWRR